MLLDEVRSVQFSALPAFIHALVLTERNALFVSECPVRSALWSLNVNHMNQVIK